jgi:CRISPR/Cas system CSM-associated protein Csm2 small subunit
MRKIKIKSKINKNTIDVIIFTYKRAILLDACIKSIIKFSSNINYPINIIYNYDKDHHKSYVKLKKIYGNKIKFHTRNKKNIFNDIRLLLRPLNIIWIYKWKRMLNNYSNFKDLLENILRDSKSELTMLCTDDTFFYKKNHINKKICEKIIKDGKNSWFRPNFGSELEKSNFTTKIFFNKKKIFELEC